MKKWLTKDKKVRPNKVELFRRFRVSTVFRRTDLSLASGNTRDWSVARPFRYGLSLGNKFTPCDEEVRKE